MFRNRLLEINLKNIFNFIFFLAPLFIVIGPVLINLYVLIIFIFSVIIFFKENIKIQLKHYEIFFFYL